jgi:hypothetical protein
VPPLPYSELVKIIERVSDRYQQRGAWVVRDVSDVVRTLSYTDPGGFAIMMIHGDKETDVASYIRVAGGGAMGAHPGPGFFRHLVLKSQDFIYGGPFVWGNDETVTFGHRLMLPADNIESECGPSYIRHLFQMVSVIGSNARAVAEDILPETGGRLLDGSAGPEDDRHLMQSQMLA